MQRISICFVSGIKFKIERKREDALKICKEYNLNNLKNVYCFLIYLK